MIYHFTSIVSKTGIRMGQWWLRLGRGQSFVYNHTAKYVTIVNTLLTSNGKSTTSTPEGGSSESDSSEGGSPKGGSSESSSSSQTTKRSSSSHAKRAALIGNTKASLHGQTLLYRDRPLAIQTLFHIWL
ncbi:hypothetical protein E2C01_056247 [Portunus trituberculatus]|uniref:Uncharacterized protein n=1 Tax=Portunus trituberculatus TaxID=210409 RepID=A0A5B7GZZ9_PORTR|nr:hypothetical protein [Portunus trituberculatus]